MMARVVFLMLALLLSTPSHASATHEKPLNASEYCLAINLYYEARFEPRQAIYGVAYVTANRSIQRRQTMCHVVFAYKQFSWVDQYHVLDANNHIKPEFRPRENNAQWKVCKEIARDVIAHPEGDFTAGAQYFVAHYIYPKCQRNTCKWTRNMNFAGRYGSHLFFRDHVRAAQLKRPQGNTLWVIRQELRAQPFSVGFELTPEYGSSNTLVALTRWRLTWTQAQSISQT